MSRFVILPLVLVFACIGTAQADWGWNPDGHKAELRQAREAIANFRHKDPSLRDFFDKAEGWAVFPSVGKVGFWIGGAYGKGVVFQGGKVIGYTSLKQLTIGLQFGGQAYSEVIFFRDKKALERFESKKLEFDAQMSAVAANQGVAANTDYHQGIAVFTLAKGGLMAEASVGGQQFSFTPKTPKADTSKAETPKPATSKVATSKPDTQKLAASKPDTQKIATSKPHTANTPAPMAPGMP